MNDDGKPAGITPSQTVGPYFAYALTPFDYAYRPLAGPDLTTGGAAGEAIRIEGQVIDGKGNPVPDAMIEIWQADGAGRFAERGANTGFTGFGRAETKAGFAFRTVKPGRVEGPDGRRQAPHIDVGVFARGLTRRLMTRIYFDDETANADDPILTLVPAERRHTLIARRSGGAEGVPRYVFDIRLQGEDETVFFEA
jgi:protocatechuate 3,4-dioxygenase alpha subunit